METQEERANTEPRSFFSLISLSNINGVLDAIIPADLDDALD